MSTFYERFNDLCAMIHKTPSSVVNEIGLSNSIYTAWKNGSQPSVSTVHKIASYFNLPTDVIRGYAPLDVHNTVDMLRNETKKIDEAAETSSKNTELSKTELTFLKLYNSLSEENKLKLIGYGIELSMDY